MGEEISSEAVAACKSLSHWHFPGGPMVEGALSLLLGIQSLLKALRSHMPFSEAKKKNQNNPIIHF